MLFCFDVMKGVCIIINIRPFLNLVMPVCIVPQYIAKNVGSFLELSENVICLAFLVCEYLKWSARSLKTESMCVPFFFTNLFLHCNKPLIVIMLGMVSGNVIKLSKHEYAHTFRQASKVRSTFGSVCKRNATPCCVLSR